MANEKRLIDANALAEKIGNMKNEITHHRGGYKYCDEDEKKEWDKLDIFDSLIYEATTMDAVEVVRCKDCKWAADFSHSYQKELFADGALNCVICRGDSGCGLNCSIVMPNDFCSDGERREGE